MYFPIGWPKVVKIPDLGQAKLRQIVCNRDKILFAILSDDSLAIWFCKVNCCCCVIVFILGCFIMYIAAMCPHCVPSKDPRVTSEIWNKCDCRMETRFQSNCYSSK